MSRSDWICVGILLAVGVTTLAIAAGSSAALAFGCAALVVWVKA